MGEPGLLCLSHGLAGSRQGNECPGSWEEATGKLQVWQEAGSWPHPSSREAALVLECSAGGWTVLEEAEPA